MIPNGDLLSNFLGNVIRKVYVTYVAPNSSVTTDISTNARESMTHYIAYCVGNTGDKDNTWVRIYLLRRGYSENHITATEIIRSGSLVPDFTFTATENGNIQITRNEIGGNTRVVFYELRPYY